MTIDWVKFLKSYQEQAKGWGIKQGERLPFDVDTIIMLVEKQLSESE